MKSRMPSQDLFLTRRDMLTRCGMGLGALALSAQLQGAAKKPPLPAKAKRVLHLFMNGGCSHVDTFDPKPALTRFHGKPIPITLKTERRTGAAFGSPFAFARHGQSGIEVSEIFSNVGACVDDLCIIRSMHTDIPNHEPSLMMLNCGDVRQVRPSFGSWVTYGLGTENENLPGFIVLCPDGLPTQGNQNWRSAFLPGAYQATHIDTREVQMEKLIENIRNTATTPKEQRRQLDLLQQLNRGFEERRQNDALLEARVQSFELAYRMQMEADDAFDLSKEPAHIHKITKIPRLHCKLPPTHSLALSHLACIICIVGVREGVIAPFLAFVPDNGFKSVCQLKWVYSITHPHSDVHRTHPSSSSHTSGERSSASLC